MLLVYSTRFWISFIVLSLIGFGLSILFSWDELGTWYYEVPWYMKIAPCYAALFVSFLIVVFSED
ncbi:hypothetical protein EO157G_2010 [Escherichia phage SP27]|uniref:Uncharacterized protein n=2 Tax=Asteriusvirus TaxID=2560094 RepID=A0A5A4U5K7_9CAUD|nr:hypothetical protein PBI_121Q_218 [Escherichia phage 121Q]AIT14108.1 hypothetical protein PBI_121Q_218 [Escherichia phage 121Q]BBM61790.1 hypothetical protein EO157G_2010 [Escherichia phage SP27]